jgi:hypothetical protein
MLDAVMELFYGDNNLLTSEQAQRPTGEGNTSS